jgi:hypothetical protein
MLYFSSIEAGELACRYNFIISRCPAAPRRRHLVDVDATNAGDRLSALGARVDPEVVLFDHHILCAGICLHQHGPQSITYGSSFQTTSRNISSFLEHCPKTNTSFVKGWNQFQNIAIISVIPDMVKVGNRG